MILPKTNQKSYGVLHTENYFSFLGFCKKVNSNELQKVDVYLDNVLIDTIIADKHLQKIEDIYELEGFGFSYNLPKRHIGGKHIISFRNHETKEDVQNSPYTLINNTNENFNEVKFLYSLYEPINEKLKNMYCSNSIGFLATKENLDDQDFIDYIKELKKRFSEAKFKAFYTNLNNIKNKKDDLKFIEFIFISDINDVIENTEIFILNNYKVSSEIQLFSKIRETCKNILAFHSNFSIPNYKSLTIEEVEKYWEIPLLKFIDGFEKLGFIAKDISEDKSYTKSYSNTLYRKFNLGKPITNLEQNAYEYFNFKTIEYTFSNKEFKEFYFNMVSGQLDILYGNNG